MKSHRKNVYGDHANRSDEITTTTTNAPRHVEQSFGYCTQCPMWRGQKKLVDGLCEDHRFYRVPPTEAKRQRLKHEAGTEVAAT